MDSFFASLEIRDKPHLKNKPVAVGGKATERGVLTTCNYIARSMVFVQPCQQRRLLNYVKA